MNNLKITAAGIALVSLLVFAACKMEVSDPVKANIGAYISENPISAVFMPGTYSIGNPPKLEAKTWDWDTEDGELYYQWFKFESIADYLENDYKGDEIDDLIKGEEDAEGKTISSHTLDISNTTPGKIYYYYVEVTNIISNGKEEDDPDYEVVWMSDPVRSDIATITFARSGEGEYPVISRQPASATYVFGSNMSQLGFKLKKLGSGNKLSYQWYKGELDVEGKLVTQSGNPKGEEISDATLEYLLLLPRTGGYSMNLKDNFFWVEITNTPQSGTPATVTTIPAKITLNPAARAQSPRILKQPGDRIYLTGQTTLDTIVFNAESTDFGDLTFQWYSNTTPANSGGALITGATDKTYTPTVSTEAEGDFYYYVVVTNTNENVTGAKTATLNSKIARVSVKAVSAKTANASVTVRDPTLPDNRFNYVRGYGGMNVAWANFPEEKAIDTETMYNPDKMGFNIMRIMIPPANTNIDISMNDLTSGNRPDYYESVKIVNKYGGYVLASPWSPPKEWKSNNSINGGGRLIPRYYLQYANYLKSFAQHMYDRGAPIYAISIANEPNYVAGYDGCEWSNNEMRDFYKEVGHFTNGVRGYGGGMDIQTVLTVNGESANTPRINDAAIADTLSRSVIDLYARHVYGEQTTTLWDTIVSAGKADWKQGSQYQAECWMTEHNINSANATAYQYDSTWNYVWKFMNDVDLVMRINKENAFVWWASKRFYSMLGDNQNGAAEGTPLPRGWGLSHYAKYSIHSTRVGIDITGTNGEGRTISVGGTATDQAKTDIVNSDNFTLDNLSAKITAYVSYAEPVEMTDDEFPLPKKYPLPDEITMVLWTPTKPDGTNGTSLGTIEIKMPTGFEIGSASAVRSLSATRIMEPEVLELNAARNCAYVELPESQIVSIRFTRK
jgi:O-glycosyl hydrolase